MRSIDENTKLGEAFESRTELLLGKVGVARLKKAHVIVFGVGGVGGSCIEALVRAGVGRITIVDNDTVCNSNRNRQIIATVENVGCFKVDAMKRRILSINPEAQVYTFRTFFDKDTFDMFLWEEYDYIADAIDCVSSKILLAETAWKRNINIISCMGTGNKLDPTAFRVADINRTSVCPLAKVMRTELRKRGVKKLKTVFSAEEPVVKGAEHIGSVSFMPPVAGMIMAGEIIKELASGETETVYSVR